jgi:hypothetical protein
MATSRGEMNHEEGREGEGGGSGTFHMTKVLFGDVKVSICGHKNQHTVLM